MAKDLGSETLESVNASAQQQIQVQIDDADAPTTYSSQVIVGGSAEEIVLNFAAGLRPTGQQSASLKVQQKVVMSPWAAKRLAIALQQTMERYEQAYGKLELDERRRRAGGAPAGAPAKLS